MRVVPVIPIRYPSEAALAGRQLGGRSWIATVVERLKRARSAVGVVVICKPEWRDRLAEGLDQETTVLESIQDPLAVVASLVGQGSGVFASCEGIAFCPVTQLFVDPESIDAMAALEVPVGAAQIVPVLACEPLLALTGGAFVNVLTTSGLAAAAAGAELSALPSVSWPTWPTAPELRLETGDELQWAVTAADLIGDRLLSAGAKELEDALDLLDLGRFTFHDGVGRRPLTIVTVRCTREPVFASLVGHLRRLRPDSIDVICPASLADSTSRMPGVSSVLPYAAPRFSVEALGAATAESIQGREYDLCVVPRLEPTAHGHGNVTPLGVASGARTAIWLDIFGNSGLLAGRHHGWDRSLDRPSPFLDPHAMGARARTALDHFTNRHDEDAWAPATGRTFLTV